MLQGRRESSAHRNGLRTHRDNNGQLGVEDGGRNVVRVALRRVNMGWLIQPWGPRGKGRPASAAFLLTANRSPLSGWVAQCAECPSLQQPFGYRKQDAVPLRPPPLPPFLTHETHLKRGDAGLGLVVPHFDQLVVRARDEERPVAAREVVHAVHALVVPLQREVGRGLAQAPHLGQAGRQETSSHAKDTRRRQEPLCTL